MFDVHRKDFASRLQTPMGCSIVFDNNKKKVCKPEKKKARKSGSQPQGTVLPPMPYENLDPNIGLPDGKTSREKYWVEDMVECINAIYNSWERNPEPLLALVVPEADREVTKHILYSFALEFCFAGTVTLQGETYTQWSKLREKMRGLVRDSQSGFDVSRIAGDNKDTGHVSVGEKLMKAVMMNQAGSSSTPGNQSSGAASAGSAARVDASSAATAATEQLLDVMAADATKIAAVCSFLLGATSTLPIRANPIYNAVAGKLFELAHNALESQQPTISMNSLMTDVASMVFGVVDFAVLEVQAACIVPFL